MRPLAILLLALSFSACGGGDSSDPPPSNGGINNPGTPSGSQIQAARVVTVGPGQVVNSIDINVPAPASSSQPNAELLGVTEIGAGGSAFNSGSAINRGTSKKIIIFGRGMSGSLQVSISGPQDITISNVRSISAEDDSPGVAFDVNVSGSAALGARTVILRSANNDITTFTGGLEVVP